jgi:hypothetical protein
MVEMHAELIVPGGFGMRGLADMLAALGIDERR